MSDKNFRTKYPEWLGEFYKSSESTFKLQSAADAYYLSDVSIPKDEVVEAKSTILCSNIIDIGDALDLRRRKAKSEIVPHDILWFSSRYKQRESTQEKFDRFCASWKRETEHMSCPDEMILHPAYLRIIGLGPEAIPLILAELERELDFWFWALEAITDENPIPIGVQGDMKEMRLCWLEWGRDHGYRFGQQLLGKVI